MERSTQIKYKGRFVYNWFSNFEPIPLKIDGVMYPSVENYFQSMKSLDPDERRKFETCSPSQAKFMGRKLKLRSDWDSIKDDIMRKAIGIKFATGTPMAERLMAESGEIIEWNNWNDRYWGKTLDNVGENMLGKILMEQRDLLLLGKTLMEQMDLLSKK